ncbi:MAG: methyltransferase domain-containing protein [Candidatus Bathyarchaeia archaeon]
MLRRTRNSLLFGWATLLSATVGLGACILILAEERFQSKRRVGKQLGAFLVDKRRAMIFYRVLSKVYDRLNVFFYTDTMRNDVAELAHIHQGSRVLDVGCGTGYTTEAVLKRLEIGEVDGIDMTSQQLRKAARKLNPKKVVVNLSRGDAENLPFRNETFGAIISFGALEYFPNPERALQEMARVVKPRGRVVVGGPESEWFKRIFLDRMLYTPSAKEVVELFNQAKFRDVRCVLTGVDTFFHTDGYVVIVVGTR